MDYAKEQATKSNMLKEKGGGPLFFLFSILYAVIHLPTTVFG
jgi:hypothetical protein